MPEITLSIPQPHAKQVQFIDSPAKRKIIRAGRRSGKTVGVGILAAELLLRGRRILYATPTSDQIQRFWSTTESIFRPAIQAGIYRINQTLHTISLPGTEARIRAKTAWNANSLRGDYADVIIFDEFQMMNEDAWRVVGAPMLLDNDGDAVFIYTPPSLVNEGSTKAKDPHHASKLFQRAKKDKSGRWLALTFSSHENPHISAVALEEITKDMDEVAYRQEILAEDIEQAPGALWTREILDHGRFASDQKLELDYIVIAVDPSASSAGDEAGILVTGVYDPANDNDVFESDFIIASDPSYYVLEDCSLQGSPLKWAQAAVKAYHRHKADCIVAEANNGGEMVSTVINQVDPDVPVQLVYASRGKRTRAQPISSLYEKNYVHHIGRFPELEDEMCLWTPGQASPNRMDALVWGLTHLSKGRAELVDNTIYDYDFTDTTQEVEFWDY